MLQFLLKCRHFLDTFTQFVIIFTRTVKVQSPVEARRLKDYLEACSIITSFCTRVLIYRAHKCVKCVQIKRYVKMQCTVGTFNSPGITRTDQTPQLLVVSGVNHDVAACFCIEHHCICINCIRFLCLMNRHVRCPRYWILWSDSWQVVNIHKGQCLLLSLPISAGWQCEIWDDTVLRKLAYHTIRVLYWSVLECTNRSMRFGTHLWNSA